MSSGWPPEEEDDRRRMPARRASVVGTVHDSRDAVGGYSGYAPQYAQDQDASGGLGHDDDGTSYDDPSWYDALPTPRNGSYGAAGYSQPASGQPGAGAGSAREPGTSQGGTGQSGYWNGGINGGRPDDAGHYGANGTGSYGGNGTAGYGANGYAAPGYDQQRYDQPGYTGHDAGPGYPAADYGNAGYADTRYAEPRYDDAGYQDRDYPGRGIGDGHGQDYQEPGYGQAGATGQHAGYGAGEAGYGDPGYQHPAYSNQEYGDPGYGDPGYGDAHYAGPAYDSLGYPDPSYPDAGYADAGYRDPSSQEAGYGAPVYADEDYSPGAGQAEVSRPADAYGGSPAYGDEPAFADVPVYEGAAPHSGTGYDEPAFNDSGYHADRGYPGAGIGMAGLRGTAGDAPDYVSPGFASGEFLAATGLHGETDAVGPGHAVTGMLPGAGVLDGAGPNATVVLGNNAAAGLLDAPGPADTSIDIPADRAGRGGKAAGLLDAPGPADTSIDIPADRAGRGGSAGRDGRIRNPLPARGTTSRSGGRRRGRSGDRRLWIVLGVIMAAAAVAIVAILAMAFPSGPGGPAHSIVTPDRVGAFIRRPALEQQMNVGQLRKDVINMSSGQASHVVEPAVYEAGTSTSGATPQIVLFIGGNLANASPTDSVTSFTRRFKGAKITSAGSLGGDAACVNATASQPGSVAICAWFDNDSFGEVVSPTMNATTLAQTMRSIRPHLELVKTKLVGG